jgi:hypothetical protein
MATVMCKSKSAYWQKNSVGGVMRRRRRSRRTADRPLPCVCRHSDNHLSSLSSCLAGWLSSMLACWLARWLDLLACLALACLAVDKASLAGWLVLRESGARSGERIAPSFSFRFASPRWLARLAWLACFVPDNHPGQLVPDNSPATLFAFARLCACLSAFVGLVYSLRSAMVVDLN